MPQSNTNTNEVSMRRNVYRNAAGIAISFFGCALLSYFFPVSVAAGPAQAALTQIAAPDANSTQKATEITIDYGCNTGDYEVADSKELGNAIISGDAKKGHLKIEVSGVMNNASIKVINVATGQIVKEQGGLKGSMVDLDVSDLSRGDYLVSVEGDLHRYTCRFNRS